MNSYELYHHGILGQKWGIRRYQNEDGSLTEAGRKRYMTSDGKLNDAGKKLMARYKDERSYTDKDRRRDKTIYGPGQKRIEQRVSSGKLTKSQARRREAARQFVGGFMMAAGTAIAITALRSNKSTSSGKTIADKQMKDPNVIYATAGNNGTWNYEFGGRKFKRKASTGRWREHGIVPYRG